MTDRYRGDRSEDLAGGEPAAGWVLGTRDSPGRGKMCAPIPQKNRTQIQEEEWLKVWPTPTPAPMGTSKR